MTKKPTSPAAPILTGVDSVGHSDDAVIAAFTLARALKSPVELLHASDVAPELWSQLDHVGVAAARDASFTRLSSVLEQAGLPKPDATTTFTVVPGAAALTLVDRAREANARMVVLGRHQRHGGIDFGNTVRAVLTKAHCPVWVQSGKPRAIGRILCAIDLSPASRAVLELARDFAKALGAQVDVLHVFVRPELGFVLGYPVSFPPSMVDTARDSAQRELRHLLEPLDWRGVTHRQEFVEGAPPSEILAAAKHADLVVMGTHGRSVWSRALLGSVAASVLNAAKVPVLVLPGEDSA